MWSLEPMLEALPWNMMMVGHSACLGCLISQLPGPHAIKHLLHIVLSHTPVQLLLVRSRDHHILLPSEEILREERRRTTGKQWELTKGRLYSSGCCRKWSLGCGRFGWYSIF